MMRTPVIGGKDKLREEAGAAAAVAAAIAAAAAAAADFFRNLITAPQDATAKTFTCCPSHSRASTLSYQVHHVTFITIITCVKHLAFKFEMCNCDDCYESNK